MAIHETEEEQVEALKKWWKEYGTALIAGLLVGFVVLAGWRYWTDYKAERSGTASARYEQMLNELRKSRAEAALGSGKLIIAEFADTPYAALASLLLARIAVDNRDYPTARYHLEWAMTNTRQPGVADIARLRLARVLVAQGETDAALGLVRAASPGSFAAEYAELEGDIHVAMQHPDLAGEAYRKALASRDLSAADRGMLQMKLDNL